MAATVCIKLFITLHRHIFQSHLRAFSPCCRSYNFLDVFPPVAVVMVADSTNMFDSREFILE